MTTPCFNEHSFIYGKQRFPSVFPSFSNKLKITSEIVYQDLEDFRKYENSKILILGGGPSSEKADLTASEYDYVWSMNHFFLRYPNTKIDLMSLGSEVNLDQTEFLGYIKKYRPHIGVEWHDKWSSNPEQNKKIKDLSKENSFFCWQSRWLGCVGVGVRLIILGCELKSEEIHFAGFDGPSAMVNGDHHFQKGKVSFPAGLNGQNADDAFSSQYKVFWNYIEDTYKTKIKSIDTNNPYHKKVS